MSLGSDSTQDIVPFGIDGGKEESPLCRFVWIPREAAAEASEAYTESTEVIRNRQ